MKKILKVNLEIQLKKSLPTRLEAGKYGDLSTMLTTIKLHIILNRFKKMHFPWMFTTSKPLMYHSIWTKAVTAHQITANPFSSVFLIETMPYSDIDTYTNFIWCDHCTKTLKGLLCEFLKLWLLNGKVKGEAQWSI